MVHFRVEQLVLHQQLADLGLQPREIHGDALPRGYAGDEPVPAASVVAHNALIASAAAAVLVRLMADPSVEAGDRVFWVYDGLRGAVRPVALRAVRDCAVCADVQGRGDSVELPCVRVRTAPIGCNLETK